MANNFIQVPPDSTGKKVQTFENTVGGNTVESEAVTLVRSSDNSEVGTAAQPLVVQGNAGAGSTSISVVNAPLGLLAVTGSVINNSAPPVSGAQLGVIPAIANAANPTLNEGDAVMLSEDLSGHLRVVSAGTPASVSPATQNITTQDLASSSTTGFDSQPIITGTPTAGSAASFALTNFNTVRVQVTGTWTGTLQSEFSIDSGTTWYISAVHLNGTSFTAATFTANFQGATSAAGITNFRLRATAAVTGTAVVAVTESIAQVAVNIITPIRLQDTTTQSIGGTIKAASTAAVATDTALVVAVSPNNTIPTSIASSANTALAAWTSATALNTTAAVVTNDGEWNTVTVTLNQTTTITAGAITFQISEDGTNWINALPVSNAAATLNGTYTFVPSTYVAFQFSVSGFKYFQVVLSTAIVGSGTVTVGYELHAGQSPSRNRVSISKITTIETTTPLAANGVFTGPWHDSSADGTVFVSLASFSNVTAAANGIVLQETDDTTNANLFHTINSLGANTANALQKMYGVIRNRYWRVTYTNGATLQASFELTTSASNVPILINDTGVVGNNSEFFTPPICVGNNSNSSAVGEGSINSVSFTGPNATTAPLNEAGWVYGGSFSGTNDAARVGWWKYRTPTVFRTVQASASGNTAVWTPASGNKFRLLKLFVEVTDNAALAAGAVLTINFQDATTSINISFDVFVPTTPVTTVVGDGLEQELDLGQFGILSAAANNVLNVNLSATLTAGNVRVIAMGTEE